MATMSYLHETYMVCSALHRDRLAADVCKIVLQVKGLAFNQLSPNLLASGGADGDIIIWDVANPKKPTAFPPLKASFACGVFVLVYDNVFFKHQLIAGHLSLLCLVTLTLGTRYSC